MDFGKALLLIAVVFALVEWVAAIWPAMPGRIKPAVALAASLVATFVVAETVWAKDQIVGNQTLEDLGTFDLIVVAILLAATASAGKELLRTVTNIGENQPKPPAP